ATDFIESLDRGLRVLELFGGGQQPMTLSDLAKAADLPRATARRILFTLERAGFVASDGKLFRLTPRVLVLASAYLASNHVVSVRRYDGTIVAAINMGAHVDRVSASEMIERFLPPLREAAASVKSLLV